MDGNIRGKFKVSYENEATGSYFVIEPGEWDQLIDYQVEMIANNPTPSILPISVKRKDNKVRVYYNITSKIPLNQLLRRKFGKNEFVNILQGIIKVILESKNYFLSDNCFVLDDELIFLNPDTLEVSLVYFPVVNGSDVNTDFKNFLIKIIVNASDVVYSNDNFIQRILSYAGNGNFNISEFKRHLDELREPDASSPNITSTGNDSFSGRNDNSGAVLHSSIGSGGDKTGKKANVPSANSESMKLPGLKIPVKAGKKPDIPETTQKIPNQYKPAVPKSDLDSANSSGVVLSGKFQSQLIITGAIFQAVILAISGIVVLKADVKALGGDTTITYFGIFIVIAAVSFLMWRKILEKAKAVPVLSETPGNKDIKAGISHNSINMDKYEFKRTDYKPEVLKDSGERTKSREDIMPDINKTIPMANFAGGIYDTVILEHKQEKFPVLKTLRDGEPDTVVINKSNFIIGRLKGQVDYVHTSSSVGKVHAEIISRDGVYFLKDLNSRNGTFINGMKIESNKEYRLNDNDKITLANTEFMFLIRQ